jgi:glucose-1-phosphate cytidylyltransferase
MLEREPLVKPARDGQLNLHQLDGFRACVDTQRDREQLTKLVESGSPPWLK